MNKTPSNTKESFIGEGFRLQKLEVYNWGTFHHKVTQLNLAGAGALLTGDNGSGKSTLVDALLTLLVPNKKRNYNLSSGSDRRERSESSYVRGAYGREQNEFNKDQSKYLRQENQFSVLIAQFLNPGTEALISLAQFFWFDDSGLRKFFVVSHKPLSVEAHFSKFKNPNDLRASLRVIPSTLVLNTFSEYEAYFVKFVGLRSSRALDLFNQITTIKEVGRLNDFVRSHMLDLPEFDEVLAQLHQNYLSLAEAHQEIVLAKRQLAELDPIAAAGQSFRAAQNKLLNLDTLRGSVSNYFDQKRLSLITAAVADRITTVASCEADLSQITAKQTAMESESRELEIAMNQDGAGQTLDKIDLLIRQQEERLQDRDKVKQDYLRLAKLIGVKTDTTKEQFAKAHKEAVSLKTTTEEAIEQAQKQRFDVEQQLGALDLSVGQLTAELESARQQKNQLPMRHLEIRRLIADKIGTNTGSLPFIAELMRVKPTELEWEPSIEKVLGGFGLRLLVPEEQYQAVNRFLAKTNVGMKLVYHLIPQAVTESRPRSDAARKNSLIAKLEFKQKSGAFGAWVQDKIVRDYDYYCAETLAEFQKHATALSKTGLVRRGGSYHEKDDRFDQRDRSRFVLGWDNSEKLTYLQKALQDTRLERSKLQQQAQVLADQCATLRSHLQPLHAFINIDQFERLDIQTPQMEIARLQASKRLVSASGKDQTKLRDRIAAIRTASDELRRVRDELIGKIGVLRADIKNLEKQLASIKVEPLLPEAVNALEGYLAEQKLKLQMNDLYDLEHAYRHIVGSIESQQKLMQVKVGTLQTSLLKRMTSFRVQFPVQSTKLEASAEYLDAFLDIKANLEKESLPDHERRFKNLLNKNVISDMLAFKSRLELAYEDVEESISRLNESLLLIPYSKSTYVQIRVQPTRDVEIREFQAMLKNALVTRDQEGTVDLEESFIRIKKILDLLTSASRWQEKVIDVRYWGDFHIAELFSDGSGQKNYYSDSAGLSGGQKAKLAFTILASAIAYQFGLNEENHNKDKSFRFVVIDEAFSKSDETNSRFAMELFQLLGLQLMVVTPRDKMHVVEPHVRNIFFTQMDEVRNVSSILPIGLDHFVRSKEAIGGPTKKIKQHSPSITAAADL